MLLHVQYENDQYDYIDAHILDRLLKSENVKRFFRPSEGRWVNVFRDPIRGVGGDHMGPDRRQLNVTK